MPDRRLALLEDLERGEEEVAADLAELDELYAAGEQVRLGAHDLVDFFERLPEEREAAARGVEESAQALHEARAAFEQAEQELAATEHGDDQERLAAARRFHIRTRDALHLAERRAQAAEDRAAELETAATAAEEHVKELNARARELADALDRRPRVAAETEIPPDASPAQVAEWGTQARAALLVARSQVAAERDALVRQANELASNAVGEPVAAMSAAGAADLLRRTLESP
jgi:predicted  nucleic acid-binding Zn-ribbon protein